MSLGRYIAILVMLAGTAVASAAGIRTADPLSDQVQAAATSFLAEHFPDYAPRLSVRVVRIQGSVEDGAPLHVRIATSEGVPRGHTQARIVIETDRGPVEAGWTVLYVAHFDTVAVAHRDLARGETVGSGDVGTAWLDVTTFRGRPLDGAIVARLNAGETFFAEKPIAAGDALRTGDLRPPYAADTGQTVTLTYRRGPILLKLPCRAREAGVVGDVIRLYGDATQSTYKARLTASGEAEWVATL